MTVENWSLMKTIQKHRKNSNLFDDIHYLPIMTKWFFSKVVKAWLLLIYHSEVFNMPEKSKSSSKTKSKKAKKQKHKKKKISEILSGSSSDSNSSDSSSSSISLSSSTASTLENEEISKMLETKMTESGQQMPKFGRNIENKKRELDSHDHFYHQDRFNNRDILLNIANSKERESEASRLQKR